MSALGRPLGAVRPRGIFVLCLILFASLVAAAPAAAQEAVDVALSPEQEATAKRLETKLMGPCCWTQPLSDAHLSEEVVLAKAQVRSLLAQGNTEQQVLDVFIAQYGQKILTKPRASGFNWLAYVLPPVGVALAGGVVLVAIRRWRGPASSTPVPVATPSSGPDAPDSEYRRRVQEELDSFDA